MAATSEIRAETESRMKKTLDSLKREFQRIRTGRASTALLDGITVDYYGSPMPVNQVASVSIPDARTIAIQPWEKSMIGPIEKAIQTSDLGLNPMSDGNVVRLPIPPLSEERRRDLCKACKKIAEDSKVSVRNIRRDSNDKLKKAEKEKEITQDMEKKELGEIQRITDNNIKAIDDLLALKENEIMEV